MNILFNFNPADMNRPSFFEMFIETQMMPSLKPALKYIFSVLAQRVPRLNWCVQWIDEIFYAALFILERHYLRHYDGSFSENFYGLKRVPVNSEGKKTGPLKSHHRKWSLFFLVVVPYLKDKLDKLYKTKFGYGYELEDIRPPSPQQSSPQQQQQQSTLTHRQDVRMSHFLWNIFKVFYPIFNAFYEGLFFLYQVLYMYNYTIYYTPFLHMQRLVVKRIQMSDLVQQSRKQISMKMQRFRDPKTQTFFYFLWHFVTDSVGTLLDYSKYILPMGIFIFKFLEWWYTENRFVTTQQPIPSPPEPPKRATGGLEVPADKRICAICQKVRTNPAMASSGFIYCYPCIVKYVQKYQRCPITFIPCTEQQIRKIYDDEQTTI
jgi:peroxin-12